MTPKLRWEGDLPLRYDFASDNVAGAMPEAIEALVAANTGFAAGYGADHVGQRAADLIRQLLDADAEVRFVPSGTAGNALTIAALAAPHEAVICHQDSHIATDETGAPGFFGSGVGLIKLGGGSVVLGVLQIALGTATVALTLVAGRRLGLGRWSFAAALFVACDPLLIVYTTFPMTETLFTFLVIALVVASLDRKSVV